MSRLATPSLSRVRVPNLGFVWRIILTSPFTHLPAPTRKLILLRSELEIVELHRQLCDAYADVPCPAFPIRPSASPIAERISSTHHPFLRLASRTYSATRTQNSSQSSVTITTDTLGRVPVELSASENMTKMALAWYLTALSNDPFFRQ